MLCSLWRTLSQSRGALFIFSWLFLSLFFTPFSAVQAKDIRIDDADSTYFSWSAGGWHVVSPQSPCTDCGLKNDPSRMFRGTWKDGGATANPSGQIRFRGTAVALYGISLNEDGQAGLEVQIDGKGVNGFSPRAGRLGMEYDFQFFHASGLSDTEHTVFFRPTVSEFGQTMVVDYAIITVSDDPLPPPPPADPTTQDKPSTTEPGTTAGGETSRPITTDRPTTDREQSSDRPSDTTSGRGSSTGGPAGSHTSGSSGAPTSNPTGVGHSDNNGSSNGQGGNSANNGQNNQEGGNSSSPTDPPALGASSSGSNTGPIAGGVVGGLVVLILLVLLLFRRRRRERRQHLEDAYHQDHLMMTNTTDRTLGQVIPFTDSNPATPGRSDSDGPPLTVTTPIRSEKTRLRAQLDSPQQDHTTMTMYSASGSGASDIVSMIGSSTTRSQDQGLLDRVRELEARLAGVEGAPPPYAPGSQSGSSSGRPESVTSERVPSEAPPPMSPISEK